MSSSASRANSGFRTAVSKVSGTPRKLNYNTSNQCGALAAVINLCYIDDYKDNNCLSDSYSNNPRSLFNTLNNYIPRETSRNGIINGLSNAKKDKICSFTSSPDAYYGGDSLGILFLQDTHVKFSNHITYYKASELWWSKGEKSLGTNIWHCSMLR